MARYHTCKSSSRRWPVAVYFNILDCACINPFIIYSLVTKTKLARRQFLVELIKELCKSKDGEDSSAPCRVSTETPSTSNPVEVQRSRKRRECQLLNLHHVATNQNQVAKIVEKSVAANTSLKK